MNNYPSPGKTSLQSTPPFGDPRSALLLLRKQVEQLKGNGSVGQNGWCWALSIGMGHFRGNFNSRSSKTGSWMPTRSRRSLRATPWRTSRGLAWLERDPCWMRWGRSVMGAEPQQRGQLGGLLQECTADPDRNVVIGAPTADSWHSKTSKKSTDIHIILMCHFQCKISRLLLTHIQHTWGHNPSKQSWSSHADTAGYNIRKKINNPLPFATLSTCDTFWTSRLILKKNENRKSKASIMNPLTHLSFLSIGMWNNFTLCGGTEEQRCLSEENLEQCLSWAVTAAL